MSYFYTLLTNFYEQLDTYYQTHRDEFSTLPTKNQINHHIYATKYRLINDYYFYYHDIYRSINDYSFDFDFLADCLEESIYVKYGNKNQQPSSDKWHEYLINENNRLSSNVTKIVYMTTIINYFVKKIRLYYQNDFFDNNELRSKILEMKHQISLLFLQNRTPLLSFSSTRDEDFIRKVQYKKMLLMDGVSQIIDNPIYSELILLQQRFYVEELEKIETLFINEGNKFRCSDEVFQIFWQFIRDFRHLAIERIRTLTLTKYK